MVRKINILAFAFVFFFFMVSALWAAGSKQARPPQQEKAEDVLERLRQAYVDENIETFFKWVSKEPYFNWVDFKSRITARFRDFNLVDASWFIDDTLLENDKVIFKMHWQNRMINDSTKKIEIHEGATQLIFKVKEKTKLVDYKGDFPF